jgi:enterochelin esterase-like enzyme
MKQQLRQIASVMLLLLLLVACATSTSAPENTPAAASLAATTEPSTVTPAPEFSDESKREKGEITSQALANNLIGDPATREYGVYLPAGYATSEKRYPVVYALHGYPGHIWSMSVMLPELEEMIASDQVEEMIIVFVDGSNRFGGSWYLSSPTIGDYENYIVRELVDHIDANYRTLPNRDSRGITGCSTGGDGAIHLALRYPNIFGVAAPISGAYDYGLDPAWEKAKSFNWQSRNDLDEFDRLAFEAQYLIAAAAAAASNPDKPPFYLDMPFEEIDGEVQIVQDVWDKVSAVSPVQDVHQYLDQPERLRGLMIYHGEKDSLVSVELARDFDNLLTELGVEHEYVEVPKGHCNLDYAPVLNFMSDHLAFS